MKNGSGEDHGISATNMNNSEVLLKLVDELNPDIVHVQYEYGLYGFSMDSVRTNNVAKKYASL